MSTEGLARFADAATRYCSLIDRLHELDRDAQLQSVARALAELHGLALDLPAEFPDTDELRPEGRDHRAWQGLFDALVRTIDFDQEAFDEEDFDEEDAHGLANDLADVYFDMEEGLSGLRNGAPLLEVAWLWRSEFQIHWGPHALDAMRKLHQLRFAH